MEYLVIWLACGIVGAMGRSYAMAKIKHNNTTLFEDLVCAVAGPLGLLVGATNFAAAKGVSK